MRGSTASTTQLDLFVDHPDTLLLNAIGETLVAGDPDTAREAVARLRAHDGGHPDLPALERLCAALASRAPSPESTTGLAALAAEIESVLVPVAERLLGREAPRALQPLWRRLAAGARQADLGDDDLPGVTRYWVGVALFHQGRRREALRLWLSLAWLDPASLELRASHAPDDTLRRAWDAFDRRPGFDTEADGVTPAARWFPAWLVATHRELAGLFREDEIPGADAAGAALRQVLRLLPLEARGFSDHLVRERRALKAAAAAFFEHYLRVVGSSPARRAGP